MAEERALDLRLAGQVDDSFDVPDPLGPGQRAVRADQAEAPRQLPQGEQGQQDGGFLRDPGRHGQPPRPGPAVSPRRLVPAAWSVLAWSGWPGSVLAWSAAGLVPAVAGDGGLVPGGGLRPGRPAARRTATDAPPRHAAVIAAARQDSSRSIMWRASIPAAGSCLASLINQASPASSKR